VKPAREVRRDTDLGAPATLQPEPTDPHLALTASDIVALVAQHLEVNGARPALTTESRDAAEHAAALLLGTLGAPAVSPAPIEDVPPGRGGTARS
jgi:hypothetical protein